MLGNIVLVGKIYIFFSFEKKKEEGSSNKSLQVQQKVLFFQKKIEL